VHRRAASGYSSCTPFIVVVLTIILSEAALGKIYTVLGDESTSD
jgi:hypothetical protein